MIWSRSALSMSMRMRIVVLLFFFMPFLAHAQKTNWQIVPAESSLSFTGTQNNAPISGQFNTFTGTISIDPTNLNDSHVRLVIDMKSLSLSYKDIETTLKSPDWLDANLFPQAVFESTHFTKLQNNHYQADGNLTIRGKTLPVILNFTAEELPPNKAIVKGNAMLKRTAFGIGQGEWASTDEIKDAVQVNFVISAVKKLTS